MTTSFSNTDDVIDSRDIVQRHEALSSAEVLSEDEKEELDLLAKLISDINDYSGDDASDGVTLIRDSHFEDYAQELAEDIGAVDKKAQWPNNCIDWERAARELQHDYTTVDFDGVDYWVR